MSSGASIFPTSDEPPLSGIFAPVATFYRTLDWQRIIPETNFTTLGLVPAVSQLEDVMKVCNITVDSTGKVSITDPAVAKMLKSAGDRAVKNPKILGGCQ